MEAMRGEVTIATSYTNKRTGETGVLTTEQVMEALNNSNIGLSLDASFTKRKVHGPGLIEIDVHPDMEFLTKPCIPLGTTTDGVMPGRYFVLYEKSSRYGGFSESEADGMEGSSLEGLLLATDYGQLFINPDKPEGAPSLEFEPVTLTPNENDENDREEPLALWAIRDSESGKYANLSMLLGGLAAIASLKLAIEFYGIGMSKPGPLTVKTGKLFAEAMRGKPNRADEYGDTGAEYLAEMGELKITAESKKALDTALASSKTLIQLNALATASDYKYAPDRTLTVKTTLDELLEGRGVDVAGMAKSTRSKKRAKLKEEVLSLAGTAWGYTDENGDFVRVPLAGGTCSVVRGNVSFVFSSEFMGAVLNRGAGRLALDPALLRTDEKNNPYAMPIGYKLLSHSYQNIGKPNECTLSVERLLDFVEGIPTYDEVKATDRHYDRRIIAPMERDLSHLVEIGVLEWWDYCHAKGEPLTDAEQDARANAETIGAPTPYDIAINANIQWQLSHTYNEQRTETVKSREKRAELAEAAKQRNEERNKRIERKKETYIAKKAAEKELG